MWCSYLGYDCSSSIECQYCPIWKQNNMGYYRIPGEYKYKCTCGGEFLEAVYKAILVHDSNNEGMGYYEYSYVCPFCGKEMVGLK